MPSSEGRLERCSCQVPPSALYPISNARSAAFVENCMFLAFPFVRNWIDNGLFFLCDSSKKLVIFSVSSAVAFIYYFYLTSAIMRCCSEVVSVPVWSASKICIGYWVIILNVWPSRGMNSDVRNPVLWHHLRINQKGKLLYTTSSWNI